MDWSIFLILYSSGYEEKVWGGGGCILLGHATMLLPIVGLG